MRGTLLLLVALLSRHTSLARAEPFGPLVRNEVGAQLVKYNFILENQEGIAPASEEVGIGTERNGNQVDEETTFDDVEEDYVVDDEIVNDTIEGRKIGGIGGGRGGGRGKGGSGGVGGSSSGGGVGGGGSDGGVSAGRGGGGKWAAGGEVEPEPTESEVKETYTEPVEVDTTTSSTTTTTTTTVTPVIYTTTTTLRPMPRTITPRPKTSTPSSINSVSMDVDISCNFGDHPDTTICEWENSVEGALNWQLGSGQTSNWLGGPTNDLSSDDTRGGYAFVETSQIPLPQARNTYSGAVLQSPPLSNTGPQGSCITFGYVMDGLSPADLRVVLQSETPEDPFPTGTVSDFAIGNLSEGRVLWQAEYHTNGLWKEVKFLYTYEMPHKIVFEGVPVDISDPSRLYRGFIALDKIEKRPGSFCDGFCTFSAGFCDWGNEQGDDFDWSLSRGSRNPVTGPTSDSSPDKIGDGGYTFIDSSFPRRPGDVARLSSSIFPPTGPNEPLCMRFWFHMFGPVVGELMVKLRIHSFTDGPTVREIWRLSRSAGNAWFMAQVTVSSVHDFQVVIEATVGNTGMSDIAVDEVSFLNNPCPASPQVAAPLEGDCSFEVDECGWVNSQGTKGRENVEWQRKPVRTQNERYRRKPSANVQGGSSHNEYFLNLGRKLLQPTGSTTQLISVQFPGSEETRCLSFWYFMHEPFIDVSGPSLGVLRVNLQVGKILKSVTIWKLINDQGPKWRYAQAPIKEKKNYKVVFEGMWGPNRSSGNIAIDDVSFYEGQCNLLPHHATAMSEDCSFDHGLCGWQNMTRTDSKERVVSWQMATDMHRPAQLSDRTFGTSEGYVFFDIFSTNQQQREVRLMSPAMSGRGYNDLCFTFWYAAFGAGETTVLSIFKVDTSDNIDNSSNEMMWNMTARGFDTARPEWTPAQFALNSRSPLKIMFEGQANNGGFAVDDIKILPGICKTRPREAAPTE